MFMTEFNEIKTETVGLMQTKKIGLYPGSFDPFTNGHLYLVKQASKLFDEVWIVIASNKLKQRRLDAEKMERGIAETLEAENLKNVRVMTHGGVVVRLAEKIGAQFLIRGLRDGVDYKYEENLAETNFHLAEMETVYFRAGTNSYISSSMVMELYELGEEINDLVPSAIAQVIKE